MKTYAELIRERDELDERIKTARAQSLKEVGDKILSLIKEFGFTQSEILTYIKVGRFRKPKPPPTAPCRQTEEIHRPGLPSPGQR